MDDQVDFPDFADKLNDVYEKRKKELVENQKIEDGQEWRIDILARSTGSLVVRSCLYLRRMRQRREKQRLDLPVEHLFLFSPANFGSDLAKIGRSALNAVRVSFSKSNGLDGNKDLFETGKKVLAGLEPASPTQWELSIGDLHKETYFGEYDDSQQYCFPFIFAAGTANKTLRSAFVKELQKDGTDGTIRIAGTSLNTRLYTLRSRGIENLIEVDDELIQSNKRRKYGEIAFAIFPEYDHCGIINENGTYKSQSEDLSLALPETWIPLQLLKRAKEVKSPEEYVKLVDEFSQKRNIYINSKRNKPEEGIYQQFFFNVTDDTGQEVKDFFPQFIVKRKTNAQFAEDTQRTDEFRKKVDWNVSFQFHSLDSSHAVLMLDTTGIGSFVDKLYEDTKNNYRIVLKITAKPPYNRINFAPPEFVLWDKDESLKNELLDTHELLKNRQFSDISVQYKIPFFSEFTTTLVRVILDRQADDSVLREGHFEEGSSPN